MKKLNNKITFINMVTSLLLQVITIISGFILPRIILSYFGSDINGLSSSISQFLSYISLLEGGISGVIVANLYKPLVQKDNKQLSAIIKTAESFYKKIGLFFVFYTLIVAIIYPIIFKTGFSWIFVFSLTLVLSLNLFIQYMFSLSLKNLLTADKKGYIVSIVHMIILILNLVLSIISVMIYPNIHIYKLINGILYIMQPIIFKKYVNKHYNIDSSISKDNKLLKSRWNGFAINIAYFIHVSTDITILTIFTDLQTVSIYSVYAIVTNGLKSLVSSISSGINPTVGQAYAKGNMEELNQKMDLYEYVMFILVFLLFTLAALLIRPFILIYTKGIVDANYDQLLFGVLLVLSEAFYLIKTPHLNLSYSANKFKEITIPAYIEAFINIVISILLVRKIGLVGVAIGTLCAMIYRMIFHIYFTKKLIHRSQLIFYKKFFLFTVFTLIGIALCLFILPIKEITIVSWIIHAIIYSVIFAFLYFILSLFFFKDEIEYVKKYLFNK